MGLFFRKTAPSADLLEHGRQADEARAMALAEQEKQKPSA
jgi:hypothetical protein